MNAIVNCGGCGAEVPDFHRFCGTCGASINAENESAAPTNVRYEATIPPLQARLVRVQGAGMGSVSYPLEATNQLVGRQDADIVFSADGYVSGRHAMFYMEDDSLFVRDEESVNGVFVRIHETVLLEAGDRFLVGEQLFEVQTGTGQGQNLDEDLTHFFGTELRPFHWRLQQILDGGQPGSCRCLKDGELTLGRDGCDLDFPADRFISGKHCALRMTEQGIELVDQGSRNGTYLRIKEPHRLVEADHLFIGKQLLRVELSGGAD